MKHLAGISLIVCLLGCHRASIEAGGLEGQLVVLEGRWNGLAKAEGQINCESEPKIVDVSNIGDRSRPKHQERVRVTAVLKYSHPPDKPLEQPVQWPVGYYIDWPDAKWERLKGN